MERLRPEALTPAARANRRATAARDDDVAQLEAHVHQPVTLGLGLPANELTPEHRLSQVRARASSPPHVGGWG